MKRRRLSKLQRGLPPFLDPVATPATRRRPEKILLGVRPGHRPGGKPPVRIFLRSRRRQFRAERVFVWSVEKHRDPGRIYEIHLLKGLKHHAGDCFAIPHFCDYRGRAIYNEVGQIWLTDPAGLFDRDMGDAGFLSNSDRGTSVMLVDCRRMAPAWNRTTLSGNALVGTGRKRVEARARGARLRGGLEAERCVENQDDPAGAARFELEREADAAHFLPISAVRPSTRWPETRLALSARTDGPELTRLLGARPDRSLHCASRTVRHLLERIPDDDIPWVLDRLFGLTDCIEIELREPVWIRRNRPRRDLHFWLEQLRLAARLNPGTRWRLDRRVGLSRRVVHDGQT